MLHHAAVSKCFHSVFSGLAQLLIDADGEELLMSRCQADEDAEVLGEIQA